MNNIDSIESDPEWLPHRIDASARTVEFIRVARDSLSARGFLADRKVEPADRALVTWDDVVRMEPARGKLTFIFHTAFCRSTLLVRALDSPGTVAGLNEPGILASIVSAGEAARPLIKSLLGLLARPHRPGEAVFVKPTNHANRLIPELLNARPDAPAILMTNALPPFLRSVARRGMLGRRWGRQLFLEMQSYAGMDFGMDARESFAMSDMQAAGLAWFLAQRWFALHLDGRIQGIGRERLAVLDGDRFDAERERTIAATFDFARVDAAPGLSTELSRGTVFDQHSKAGGAYHDRQAGQGDARLEEEIDQVRQWVGAISDQSGLPLPLEQTLFD